MFISLNFSKCIQLSSRSVWSISFLLAFFSSAALLAFFAPLALGFLPYPPDLHGPCSLLHYPYLNSSFCVLVSTHHCMLSTLPHFRQCTIPPSIQNAPAWDFCCLLRRKHGPYNPHLTIIPTSKNPSSLQPSIMEEVSPLINLMPTVLRLLSISSPMTWGSLIVGTMSATSYQYYSFFLSAPMLESVELCSHELISLTSSSCVQRIRFSVLDNSK